MATSFRLFVGTPLAERGVRAAQVALEEDTTMTNESRWMLAGVGCLVLCGSGACGDAQEPDSSEDSALRHRRDAGHDVAAQDSRKARRGNDAQPGAETAK